MKRKKLLTVNILILFFMIAAVKITDIILDKQGLVITLLTLNIFIAVIAVLSLSIVIQLIIILYKVYKNTQNKKKKFLSVFAVIIIVLSVGFAGFYSVLGYAFGVQPEHVVEKDGRKMVACVDSYLQVIVRYYDYKNLFVRGNQIRRFEDYGNGGYDPFTTPYECAVIRYSVYDENGKTVETSENN